MHTNDIFEAPQKTAVVAFGRMNPPTIGHRKLVDAMLAQAGDPFLFLSHTQKPATDPLSFEEKAGFAKAFFPEVTVGDSQVRTFFDAIKYVNSLGYNRLIYVAGSDRVEQFTKLAIQYNGHDDMYKFAINLFKPFIEKDKFLKTCLFNEIYIQWYETLDEYLDEEFDLFMYEYSNLKNVISNWNNLDTNDKKIDYLVRNNHILYKRLFDNTHMIHII